MNEQKIINQTLKKGLDDVKASVEAIAKSFEKKETGNNIVEMLLASLKGKDGYNPVKGKDYMTDEEATAFAERVFGMIVVPKVGKDFYTAADKAAFLSALKKLIPKFGIDYYTEAERAKFIDALHADNQKKLKEFEAGNKQLIREQVNHFAGENSSFMKKIRQEVVDMKAGIAKQVAKASQEVLGQLEKAIATPTISKAIARSIEGLKGKDRLDARKLKNLPQPFNISQTINTGGGGSGTNVSVVDLSSQLDGSTSSFVMPAYSAILMVIVTGWAPNGVLRPTTDFTTPDNTHIALVTSEVSAPISGATMIVLYVPA